MSSFSLHIQPMATTKVPLPFTPQKCCCLFIPSIPLSSPSFSSKPIFLHSNRRRRHNQKGIVLPLSCIDSSSSSSSTSTSSSVEEDYQILTAFRSSFNEIVILETAESIMLLLDSTNNIHSVLNKGNKWTSAYWDTFVSLPPIVPKGSIAIYGLGGGTVAHLLLEVWPSLQLDGWEIDETLIHKARDFFGLADLEKQTEAGGILNVIVGDALSPSATVPGGYAGIIVDLFSGGKVLPQMQEVEYWLGLQQRLMPNGRIMINCGGHDMDIVDDSINNWETNSTIRALHRAFPTQLSWMKLPKDKGANYMALTGPFPDLAQWSDALPDILRPEVQQWRTCSPS